MQAKDAVRILEVFFLPPLAIARIGGSDTPLDSFAWDSDPTIHGSHKTVIRPKVSLEVLPDGSLRTYEPRAIQFRDQGLLRPVAPFFELWALVGKDDARPVTPELLRTQGESLDSVEYKVTVANRKAQRRTGRASCAFIAETTAAAGDFEKRPLRAFSPHNVGELPLVLQNRPIPLGHFQAIKPIQRQSLGVDLSILRVRFTPAKGHVYGPPSAIAGPASPLPPGEALDEVTLGGRLHEIVPPENRILNEGTEWSSYVLGGDADPQPSDSYDGANVGDNRSWGVVDDTCDGVIEARVVIQGRRFVATARIFSSCPDYAPDRRPFYSIADDLADRDLHLSEDITTSAPRFEEAQYEVADLFERAFETASMFNLDAMRERAVNENLGYDLENFRGLPKIDNDSMTAKDKGYAEITAALFPDSNGKGVHEYQLPYSSVAQYKHATLSDWENVIRLLRDHGKRVKKMVRPPFGRLWQLPKRRIKKPKPGFRDPRNARDQRHDMRMPPYMRDSDLFPLSITFRQYDALMRVIDRLALTKGRPDSPIARKIKSEFGRKYEKIAAEAGQIKRGLLPDRPTTRARSRKTSRKRRAGRKK
jgi:hypothetical protein